MTSGALAPVPPPVLAPPAQASASNSSPAPAAAPSAPQPPRPAAGVSLYDGIAAYEASFKQEAASGQISEGRWVNAMYAMERLKLAMPDRPLATIGFDTIRTLIGHFTARQQVQQAEAGAPVKVRWLGYKHLRKTGQ